MDIETHLRAVIAAHETTTIIYHGGSAPGAARAIAPISVSGTKLTARCLETNARKTFDLAKIELAGAAPIKPYNEVMAEIAALEARPFGVWADEMTALFANAPVHINRAENAWSVHDFTRYGKPRVGALASIEYRPTTSTMRWDDDTETQVMDDHPSAQPWCVNSRSYASLRSAFEALRTQCLRVIADHGWPSAGVR